MDIKFRKKTSECITVIIVKVTVVYPHDYMSFTPQNLLYGYEKILERILYELVYATKSRFYIVSRP